MAKVTVHAGETPSEKAVTSASQLAHVTDARGRKLGLRRLDFLEEFRIVEALGAELSANATYMAMLNPLLYLAEVDGEPVGVPRNKIQAEALIQRAGREGFVAVLKGIETHFAGDQGMLDEKIKNG